MEITRRTDYATRIMLELAQLPPGERASARRLGGLAEVSYPFARSIITDLAAADLVDARRGTHGGVSLVRPASEISLLDIVIAMEGDICLNACVNEPGYCSRTGVCGAHGVWADASRQLADHLASRDLESLVSNGPHESVVKGKKQSPSVQKGW